MAMKMLMAAIALLMLAGCEPTNSSSSSSPEKQIFLKCEGESSYQLRSEQTRKDTEVITIDLKSGILEGFDGVKEEIKMTETEMDFGRDPVQLNAPTPYTPASQAKVS